MAKHGAGSSRDRSIQTKIWIKWFEEKHGRKPDDYEGQIFGHGFNHGWNAHIQHNKNKPEEKEIEDIVLLAQAFDVLRHIERKYDYVKKKSYNTDKYIEELEGLFKKMSELISVWDLYLKSNKDEARKVFMALKKDTNI